MGSFCLFPAHSCSLWLPIALCSSNSGSHWLSLPISGSILLSNFAFTVLDWLTWPLFGAQRRCHACALFPGLPSMFGLSSSFFFTNDFPYSNISLYFPLSSSSPRLTKYFLPQIFSSDSFSALFLVQNFWITKSRLGLT